MKHLLTDSYGRQADYLRVSVTDLCNMACTYCVPPEGFRALPKEEIATDEELLRLISIFLAGGVKKVRITGGEPLLRPGLLLLLARIKQLPGLQTLALSSNGVLLPKMARGLAQAGVSAVNISLDTFNPVLFRQLTGGGKLFQVLEGIEAAVEAGLKVRVNAVLLPSLTDEDLNQFAGLSRRLGVDVRFIEKMPLYAGEWNRASFVPYQELLGRFLARGLVEGEEVHDGKTIYHQVREGKGKIGFIASLSRPFCKDCVRLRLSAKGSLRPCLFSPYEEDLLKPLRMGANDAQVMNLITRTVWKKSKGHGYDKDQLEQVSSADHGLIRAIGG